MLTFIFPGALWALLLLPLIWLLTLAAPTRLAPWRRWGGLLLRSLGLSALVLALAGAQLGLPARGLSLVFILDQSDSVPLAQRARAESYVKQALAQLPVDARAALVVFGSTALVERPFSSERTLGQLRLAPDGRRSDLQAALQLGLAMLPAEGQRRIVLISDGAENSGQARDAARLAAAQGVPIEVLTLSAGADGPDGQLLRLELPTNARVGQRLPMGVEIALLGEVGPRAAELMIEQLPLLPGQAGERQVVFTQAVTLTAQPQRLNLSLPAPPPGFSRYVARLVFAGDARPENNVAEAFSFISGDPRLLLIAAQTGEAQPLAAALSAAGLSVDIVQPADAPMSLGSLSLYDAIILINVPRRALPQRTADLLPSYVRDLGRGLAMVGGENSFGAGGWRESPLEQALPVSMDLPTAMQQPPVSVVVVIDVSGSMAQSEGRYTKVQLAAEGAVRIAEQLRDFDEITVIPFDSEAQGVIGPLPGSQRAEVIERAGRIGAEGGGILAFEALTEAARVVRASDKPIRHIFTITDGSDTVSQAGAIELASELRAEGVTISAISIGEGSDTPFIRDLARVGEGRFFLTRSAQEIADILTGEARILLQPYLVEGQFTPLRGLGHPLLRGIEGMPPLAGYVASTPKASAQVLLSTPRNDPLLAVWQYGLGRSAAWTSDFSGRWASDWLSWREFRRAVSQLAAWLLPASPSQDLSLEARSESGQLVLAARAETPEGAPLAGLRVSGQLIAADGATSEVILREVAAGEYRAALVDQLPGAYLAQLVASDGQGQPLANLTAGVVVPIAGEYRADRANPGLLASLATASGGRVDPAPEQLFDPLLARRANVQEIGLPLLGLALLLLPLDIAIRRLFWGAVRNRQADKEPSRQSDKGRPTAPPVVPAAALEADPLEQMRAAQERARKRARGED